MTLPKKMAEDVLEDYGRAYGIECVSLRYFNVAGADADLETGERRACETHLIPLVLEVAAGRREIISVFGTDYPTPDGTCVRDYVHVEDIAEGHCRALEHLAAGWGSLYVNLGSGVGCSVREVIRAAERITGRPIAVETLPARPGDCALRVADIRRARMLWGWHPHRSTLRDMLEGAWRWEQKH